MGILVTGSGGRLGRLLYAASRQTQAHRDTFVFQSRSAGRDLTWSPCDPMHHLPACHTVVALWGATQGTDAELALNVELVSLSRKVAQACQAKRLFFMSSAAIYGPGQNMTEDAPPAPLNAYGRSKLAMEHMADETATESMQHACLRLANVVGADSLATALTSHEAAVLDRFKDGRGPRRSYIGASDFLRILKALSLLPAESLPKTLNIAAPNPIEMQALLNAADTPITWRDAPANAIQDVTLSVDRLCSLTPEVSICNEAEALVSDFNTLRGAA